MSPRTERAAALITEIRALLVAAGLAVVHVTVNPADIIKAMPGGAVVITPPDLAFPTFYRADITWELWAIAGPGNDPLAAWDRLDAIVAALTVPLALDVARSDAFQPLGTLPPLPAYVLTFTESFTH
jgi:hypothetical protein